MKKQLILVVTLLIYGALQAQETGNYLNFNVGGGIHNLSYSLPNVIGTQKGQFGYTINAGYSYFFTPQWGLHTGLGFQSFNSLSTLNYLSSTPDIDTDGKSYTFKANYKNWQERQQALFVDIPLTIQFKMPLSKKMGLLTSVGGNISFPVNSGFKTTGGELVTTGFYPQYNAELYDLPQHGFSTMTKTFTGNQSIKTAYMAIADLGGLYKLNEKLDLYGGAYINYGLNNILKPDTKLVYQPAQPNGIYNGVFASGLTTNVVPISVGLKVGVYWHFGDKKSTLDFVKPEDAKIEEPAVPLKAVEPVQPVEPVQTVQPVEAVTTVVPVEAVPVVVPVPAAEPAQAVQPVETAPIVLPAEPVKPVEAVQPAEPVQTVESPVQTVNPVPDVTVVEQTPKAVETPKELVAEQPVTQTVNAEEVQNEDAFKQAQKIAESMNLMFGFNSYQVRNAKNDKIKELSRILKDNSYIHVRFVGHTCNIGTHEINLIFGMKRAKSVQQKFINEGVSESQLSVESKAYDQPLVPNTSKANRAKNRRVEIKVFK